MTDSPTRSEGEPWGHPSVAARTGCSKSFRSKALRHHARRVSPKWILFSSSRRLPKLSASFWPRDLLESALHAPALRRSLKIELLLYGPNSGMG
ncbi:hypothetical protein Pr1d_48460 [Bythopirellula goksoeyrii]|uniref:Uncharacterized protein n=1 Tax=Bythopirellula goksoeyrii TaxID=1400387 RepID=A0A5B9QIV0_9BACT|nr:hypothetical protein Pr1d_48460 [Bythopirellula goksoeyrii]